MRKAALHNLGCKVNAYETEAMQQMLTDAGYEIVSFAEKADVYVINTCSVTNVADKKSRQMLHRAKKMNGEAVVVAVGCYVQAAKEILEGDSAVDLIIGNNKKKDLVSILDRYFIEHEKANEVIDISAAQEYEELHVRKISDHTRAFIKVQDGCNQFCSYCIIPYTRGRVRSRDMEDIVQEVENLSANGYKEIVLTGIHLSSYGLDFRAVAAGEEDAGRAEEAAGGADAGGKCAENMNARPVNLLALIVRLDKIKGIERIRLGSLEPRIVTEEFAKTLSTLHTICPHFHLSLQSGCDETLKRMNRRYTAQEYLDCCDILRRYFENPAITTDVIVGFPGETEGEFAETKAFLEKVHFYEMHIFKYSKREGTKAAVMENQIPEPVKAIRSDILLELEQRMSVAYRESFLGKETEVLLEEAAEIGNQSYMVGHTRQYVKVAVPFSKGLKNMTLKGILKGKLADDILLMEEICEED